MAKAFTMWYLLLSSPLCAILIGYLIDRFEVLGPNFLVIAPLVVYKHAVELIHPISQRHEIAWRPPSNFNQRPGRVGGPTPPPNVILIVADDLGFNDLSHGCGVATPNIDSIRDSGVHFTHAYAGQATCAPSRAALLTGRYSTRFGYEFTPVPPALARVLTHPSPAGVQQQPVFHKEVLRSLPRMQDMVLPANETLVSQLLQERGYDTYVVGKWDSGGHSPYTPRDRGFNESLGFTLGASLYHRNWHPDIVSLHGNPFDDFLRAVLPFSVSHNNGPPMDPDQYMTDYLADEAANLVASRSQQQQQSKGEEGEDFSPAPYFLMLTFNAPHNPYQALRSDMQDAEVQALPTQTQRVYAAMVKALDRGVGRVLEAVRDSGSGDNTVVIFTSDNGGASYAGLPRVNHPFRGWKATLFEGGLRVPLFMQWPAHLLPCTHSTPVSHVDFLPTLVAMAGGAGGAGGALDGVDLLGALGGQCVRRAATRRDPPLPRSMPSSGACPDPSTPPIVEAEAEAEAEAVEAEAEAEAEAAGASEEAMVEVVSNRTLFWRSGHYSAVLLHSPPSQWKLQVAGRPEKVWFFDLSADPTERHNLAPALGVTCRWDLDVLLLSDALMGQPSQSQQQPEQEQQQEQQQLVRAYRTLKALEREQREPLWPALSETPLRIDVMQLQPWSAPAPGGPERGVGTCAGAKEEEELVYWCN